MDGKERPRPWRLSRRRLLKIAGLAVVAGVAASVFPRIRSNGRTVEALASPDGEPAAPQRLRRWMMIIDLRRCDGCQSVGTPPQCTLGCIEGHYLPEPMEWIQVFEYELPRDSGTYFVPVPCQQCQNPPCVNVCPVGATWSTPEGVVLIDQDRCIGCRMCIAACPYDRRFFVWGNPPIPPQAVFVEYHPARSFPLRRGVTTKCDFCPDMARAGRIPYCAQSCPHHAIYYGDLEVDLATNGKEVVKISDFLAKNNAFGLKEELNTKPRVFYIPGHGEAVGRDPKKRGRMRTRWPWLETLKGAKPWKRSGR